MSNTTTEIDWQAFCRNEPHGRYGLESPWIKGGFKYASDGHLLIRVPTQEPDTDFRKERRNVPDASSVLSFYRSAQRKHIPIEQVEWGCLPYPDRDWKQIGVECECVDYTAGDEDRKPTKDCDHCLRTGFVHLQRVGHHWINHRYDKLIRSLNPTAWHTEQHIRCVFFKFGENGLGACAIINYVEPKSK